jgi:hypothetical protein
MSIVASWYFCWADCASVLLEKIDELKNRIKKLDKTMNRDLMELLL